MTIDVEILDPTKIAPNSVIVVRAAPEDLVGENLQLITQSFRELKDALHPSVRVLVLPEDMKIEAVEEKTMNQAGWFRFDMGADLAKGADITAATTIKER